ncbi:sporulation integral membrane protein YtvI [Bacillus sp. UNCCL13]|uniref:sporulation integral membrane protein YtvI n=1 Tax=Bacillus sp. UNCCL13 TaxID=1502772 RepID=UPI0034A26674
MLTNFQIISLNDRLAFERSGPLTQYVSKRIIMIALFAVLTAFVFYFVLPVSVPLLAAFFTAVILEPLVKSVQSRFNLQRKISVLIVFISFLLLFALGGYFITTKVITEAIKLVENGPIYISEISREWYAFERRISSATESLPKEVLVEISNHVEGFLNNTRNELVNYINITNVKTLLTNIPNYLVSFLVYLIALFLFLLDIPRLNAGVHKYLKERTADQVNFMASRLSYVVLGSLKAQFLVSAIIFFISLFALIFISPEIALVMAFFIAVVDFIPIFGSVVLLGPWSLFHFVTGDIAFGTKLAVLAIVLIMVRRIVEPKVMGSHIGLSALATLVAMYLGLKIFGFIGFLLGPLIIIAYNSAKEAGIIKISFKI